MIYSVKTLRKRLGSDGVVKVEHRVEDDGAAEFRSGCFAQHRTKFLLNEVITSGLIFLATCTLLELN